MITSQIPVDRWHEIIGDPTYPDAILDRLVHNAHRIDLAGESMRRTRGKQTRKGWPTVTNARKSTCRKDRFPRAIWNRKGEGFEIGFAGKIESE
jgi:hypothetical protein